MRSIKAIGAVALAAALSGCSTWYAATTPGVRIAQAGDCTYYFASSGLFWQPLQEVAECRNDANIVYLTGTAKEATGGGLLGPADALLSNPDITAALVAATAL